MMNFSPYHMFMAEAEGLLNKNNEITRIDKLNKIIDDIKKYPDNTIPNTVFNIFCNNYDIEPNSLSREEMEYIKMSIQLLP